MAPLRAEDDDGGESHFPLCLIPRFRNVADPAPGFVRGYNFQGYVSRALPLMDVALVSPLLERDVTPFRFVGFGEVLPRHENRISLDPAVVDAFGVPAAHVELTYSQNEHRLIADAGAFLREMAEAAGFEVIESSDGPAAPGASIHEVGGARMGAEAKASVVDPSCRVWDTPNVYVADGAAFPTSPSQNPTLTIMALSLRAADAVIRGFRNGSLKSPPGPTS